MNILQILPELKSGGVERGTVDLAKYLHKLGHKSFVVSAGGPLVGDLTSAGVIHYTLPVHRKSLLAVIRCVRDLSKIIKEEHVDVIHARSRVPALIAFLVSRRTEVPFVSTCHGFYRRSFFGYLMGWGKIVIAASHVIAKRMRDDFDVPHAKIRLIPRGVDLAEFPFSERPLIRNQEPVIVGIIGRITPIKGHVLFLKAMARVMRVIPNMKIQIIGDAPKLQYKEELVALAKNLGLSPVIEFMGTRYDIPLLLSKMSVLAVPSIGEEAFGRVVIEAGACGVPVVATRLGGLVDIIEDGKEGLLVPADDPRFLAEAVLRLLREPDFAKEQARALRKRVEKEFNLDLMFEKTLAVYQEVMTNKKILVIKLSAVGDVILIIPSLRALREKYPNAWIAVLVGRKSRKIIRNCPYVNDTIICEPSGKSRLVSMMKTARFLAKEDFDIVVDLQNNRASHFLSYFCGARIRAGHDNRKWAFFLNRKNKNTATGSPLEHQYHVLKLIGVTPLEKRLELWTSNEEESQVQRLLDSEWVAGSQTLVGINPASSPQWPTKQWPIENFARLCDELAKRNVRVVITGSEEDRGLTDELFQLTRNKPINAVGKTSLTELVALVRRCQVFISSDSAPMHIASSVGVPLIALFGPTDPKRHLVAPPRVQVFWKEIQCSPCYLRNCPIGHLCMKKITVSEVLDSVLYFLSERQPQDSEKENAIASS